ncbi:VWA domain-containing protein [Vibrio methylphosphonaticus]|uniref:VWA domain-containing protein n=1 Tax=Vibrio methylphosphonaticus TaxID=2946866 RepID=UPI00202A9290|nr:VWA domain-containing protein [Vibrio methylphosphonaticus]MCL9776228.1 VWA domain-containing protein [Vibrio methylphosphonaticus]
MIDTQWLEQVSTQFHFIRPLWLLALIPMAVVFYVRWKQDANSEDSRFLPSHLRQALTIESQGWNNQLPLKMLVLGSSLLIIVASGPTWQRQASPFGEDKASLMIVLDVSESMLQTDVAPNRLERAKHKIHDLLETRQGGRTGLVVYSGSAHLAMPTTQDNRVFAPFLAAIDPQIMPVAGKAAENSLPIVKQQLDGQPGSTVLLITDGATPATVDAFKSEFGSSSTQLLVLAMGNRDIVTNSPLDLVSLKQLVDAANGRLVETSIDTRDIQALTRDIDTHMEINGESAMPWKDMGYGLLVPIALLMLLWFRKGWLVQWCLLIALVGPTISPSTAFANQDVLLQGSAESNVETSNLDTSSRETSSLETGGNEAMQTRTLGDKGYQWWMDLWFTQDQQGQRLFDQQRYLEAAQHYTQPQYKGVAYYYGMEYRLAHAEFLKMDNEQGDYYAAIALARQREYLAARNMLQTVLESSAIDDNLRRNATQNLEVMESIIEEINRVSESQTNTTESMEESIELGDNPQTADGAEEMASGILMKKESLNANEILGSEALADKWLKRVEADPKQFLRAKFQLQYRDQMALGESK